MCLPSHRKIRLERLARLRQRQLLYPIWEMHTLGIMQPVYRLLQQEHEERTPAGSEEQDMGLWKGIHLHPFNFEDKQINLDRAEKLLWTMEPLRLTLSTVERWWPQDAAALVKAVKREREEMDIYGHTLGVEGRRRGKRGALGGNSGVDSSTKRQRTI